jgi:hypothetical protein
VRALRVEPDPLSDVLLNQNQTQWWDGLTWRYIHAEPRVCKLGQWAVLLALNSRMLASAK